MQALIAPLRSEFFGGAKGKGSHYRALHKDHWIRRDRSPHFRNFRLSAVLALHCKKKKHKQKQKQKQNKFARAMFVAELIQFHEKTELFTFRLPYIRLHVFPSKFLTSLFFHKLNTSQTNSVDTS